MSSNVTKCNKLNMPDLWNATNYYNVTECKCLIHGMIWNAEAETMERQGFPSTF